VALEAPGAGIRGRADLDAALGPGIRGGRQIRNNPPVRQQHAVQPTRGNTAVAPIWHYAGIVETNYAALTVRDERSGRHWGEEAEEH
jgi:hypothetical protein